MEFVNSLWNALTDLTISRQQYHISILIYDASAQSRNTMYTKYDAHEFTSKSLFCKLCCKSFHPTHAGEITIENAIQFVHWP